MDADEKINASAVQQDQAMLSLRERPHWADFDGASAVYSGSGPPNLLSEDKKEHLLLDDLPVMPSKQKREDSLRHVDKASLINSGRGSIRGSDKNALVRDALIFCFSFLQFCLASLVQSKSSQEQSDGRDDDGTMNVIHGIASVL